MVTDDLAPVITEIGVATIGTANGMKVLCGDRQFHTITVHRKTLYEYYALLLCMPGAKVKRMESSSHRLFVTPGTRLETVEGFVGIDELFSLITTEPSRMVRAYLVKCIVCGKFYHSLRPLQGVCNPRCLRQAKKSQLVARPLNAKTITESLLYDWLQLKRVYYYTSLAPIEAVMVQDIEGADSLYINGILLSSYSLQTRV